MRINIISPATSSLAVDNNGANMQGDELVARLWVKALRADPRVSTADLNGPGEYDVSISFGALIDFRMTGLKVLYHQNIYTRPAWPGTVGMFHAVKSKYDAFIFPSETLMHQCTEGLVCQFATDTDIFNPKPYEARFDHNVCFVGNNIRDKETTDKYLLCTSGLGLSIYGNPYSWNNPHCMGKLPVPDEPILYSSAKICLNAHMNEHLEFGSFNFRIFNILACKGFIISDWSSFLEREFKDCMVFTNGNDDLVKICNYFIQNPGETLKYRENGYAHVVANHTFRHRMENLVSWLINKI